jgi:hypothetical protein
MESIDLDLPIQRPSRPSTPTAAAGREPSYDIKVLGLMAGQTEDDLDRQFALLALDLGIAIPPQPTASVGSDAAPNTPCSVERDPDALPSRSSTSPSYNSSEQQQPQTVASSQTTPSIFSEPGSTVSKASSYLKFRNGLRRLSTFAKRRSITPAMSRLARHTAGAVSLPSGLRLSVSTAREDDPEPADRHRPSLEARVHQMLEPRPQTAIPPSTPEPDPDEAPDRDALERSLMNRRLQELRSREVAEQHRFIEFQDQQILSIRSRKIDARETSIRSYRERHASLMARHATADADMEQRHLDAEIDLTLALQAERKACETRLRHMDAYCNGRGSPSDTPRRRVTDEDYRKLVHQYHIRNGMGNLHEARIRVLRQRQAKQLERLAARHDTQVQMAGEAMKAELESSDQAFHRAEQDVRRDLGERKKRLLARWALAEAIERKTLENETGLSFGPLPKPAWPDPAEAAGRGWR